MSKQKYNKGDHVQVAKDLGSCMSHFQNDCEAIIIGSYKDQFGGSDTESYTIRIKGGGETSWYQESQLELIESGRLDLLKVWEDDAKKDSDMKSNLDWIFLNGEEVLQNRYGSTMSSLALCLGVTNLWGSQGEGFIYYTNCHNLINLARPFLVSGDKEGWLVYCEELKSKHNILIL